MEKHATIANSYNIPTLLISGSLEGDLQKLREKFSDCFAIVNKPLSLQEAMAQAETLL